MYKLDQTDRKLLDILDRNARISVTSLSHILNISKQLVSFRMKRLESKNIIQQYMAYIDRAKLGYQHHQFYLNLEGYDFSKIETDLEKIPNVHWSAMSKGHYNLIIYFLTRDHSQYHDSFQQTLNIFRGYIGDKHYLLTSQSHYFNQSAITYVKKEELMLQEPQKLPRLKESDYLLINTIKPNSRISTAELSRITGLSPRTVVDRIKYLRKIEVIKNFRIKVNYSEIGFIHYQVFFETSNISSESNQKLVSDLITKKETLRLTQTIGKWEISCDVILPKKMKLNDWIETNVSKKVYKNLPVTYLEVDKVLKTNTLKYSL